MLYKGIVLSVNENYSIILTNENQYKRIKNKMGLSVGQKIWVNSDDFYTSSNNVVSLFNKRSIVAAAAVIAIIFSSFFGFNMYQVSYATATVVTIDINPSVQLELNTNNKVIRYIALNEDAASLSLETIKGMAVEDAVEIVVSQAIEQGFINSDDLIDDYVLVTTIPVKGNPNRNFTSSEIKNKLEDKINESEVLQEVNVAFNKATKNELKEAKEKSVSVGLYVLDQESDQINVKEYFAEEAMVNQFEHFGTIIQKSEQAKINEINKLLNTLESLNVDVVAFRTKLSKADVNYDALIEELKGFIEQQEIQLPQKPGKSNNGNSKNETTESPATTESTDNNGKSNNGNNNSNNGKKNDQILTTEPTSESVESSTDSTTETSTEPSTEPETKNPSGKPVVPKNNNGNNNGSNKGNSNGN